MRTKNATLIKDKSVFVDTNVLIYLFFPLGKPELEKKYASVFRGLLNQKNLLFVNFYVISEIINRIIRIEHKKINPDQTFKDFRNSSHGQETLKDIYLIVEKCIFPNFDIIGKSFTKQDIKDFLLVDNLDFIDKAIVQICKENDFVLLTNDSDFKNVDLDILTCNSFILK